MLNYYDILRFIFDVYRARELRERRAYVQRLQNQVDARQEEFVSKF